MSLVERITSSSAAGIVAAIFTGAMTVLAGMFLRGRSNSQQLELIKKEQEHAREMREADRQRAKASEEAQDRRIAALETHMDAGFRQMRDEQRQGFQEIRGELQAIASRLDHKRDK